MSAQPAPENDPGIALPSYLEPPPPDARTFGKLRFQTKGGGDLWVIEAEPQVVALAKRLFPGSQGRGAGEAKFPANRRRFADLLWFLQRFPLDIESPEAFRENHERTTAYVRQRERFNAKPQRAVPPPSFTGKLRWYQEEALAWALTHRRTLIADDTGLGKTVDALAFMATSQDWPALVVPQPHMVTHWDRKAREFLAVEDALGPLFARQGLRVEVLKGQRPYELHEADIYICHYLLLKYWLDPLLERHPQTVIFDEVQELRRRESMKYTAASELSVHAENALGLSATPIFNRGGEIYNVINALELHAMGDWDSFTREWCTGYGSDLVRHPDQLSRFLKEEGLMLRRLKEDVHPDMPPKNRIVQPVAANDGVYAQLIKQAERRARDSGQAKDRFERGRLEKQAVDYARRATGLAKVDEVAAFVGGLLDAGEPTLVFAHHHAVHDRLRQKLAKYRPAFMTGNETPKQKDEAKDRFCRGDTPVAVLALRAAAGIDGLEEQARVVVFAELDWSPAVHSQCEDRAWRGLITDKVLSYFLVIDDGTDPDMQDALGLKTAQITGVMGDQPETEEQRELSQHDVRKHMRAVLERLKGRAA